MRISKKICIFAANFKINTDMKHILLLVAGMVACTTMMAQQLPVLRLTLPDSCFNSSLSVNNNLKEYQYGTMQLTDTDNIAISLPVKCKIHGATAAHYTMKPSLAMKLSDMNDNEIDSCLLGLRSCSSWILDAMAIDRINMRNRVTFDIWNAMSRLPYTTQFGSRNGTIGRFVELYINDNSYGIYCLNDKINRKLLGLKKPKLNADGTLQTLRGALYKSGTTDIADQNTPGYFLDNTVCVVEYHNAWELKEPEDFACEAAWAPLMEYYNGNHNYQYVKTHYYLENLVDNQLLIMALAIQDNWGNKNKYVSVVDMSATGDAARLVYTPWDLDTSLGGGYDGRYYGGNYSDWKPADINKNATQVFSVCVGQTEYKQMLHDRWDALRTTTLSVDSVAERLRDYTTLLEGSGAWQRQWDTFQARSSQPKLVENLSTEVELIIEWYRARFAELDEYFGISTDIEHVDSAIACPQKVIKDGEIRIVQNGRYYDMIGRLR